MRITIDSHTTLCFEIVVEHEDRKTTALLEMVGGEWHLTRTPQRGSKWVAGRRIDWPEAIKRALMDLAEEVAPSERAPTG